jgi:transposase
MLNNSCLSDFQRKQLQKSLQNQNLSQLHRQGILIMLLTDEGKSQTEICTELGCSAATASRWILLAKSGNAHQWREHRRGRRKTLQDEHLERLQELASCSPRDYGYAFNRWTGAWLAKHLAKEFGIKITPQHVNRLLKTFFSQAKEQDKTKTQSTSRLIVRDLPSAKSYKS